jgi:hypothetical protein
MSKFLFVLKDGQPENHPNQLQITADGKVVTYIKRRPSEIIISAYSSFRLYREKDGDVIGLELLNDETDHDYVELYEPEIHKVDELASCLSKHYGLKKLEDVFPDWDSPTAAANRSYLIACCLLPFIILIVLTLWSFLGSMFK